MKRLLDAVQEKMNEVDELKTPLLNKIIMIIFSIIFGVFSVIGFIGVFINLAILDQKLIKLYVFFIATLLIVFVFVTMFLYLNGISKGRVKRLWYIYLFDTALVGIFIYILMLIMFIIGVF